MAKRRPGRVPGTFSTGRESYVRQIEDAFRAGRIPPGRVTIAETYHDDWCSLIRGRGDCDCNPEVRIGDGGGS